MSIESLLKAKETYPNCRIANCSCNSRDGEWKQGCRCTCHFAQMDEYYGKDNWNMMDFMNEAVKER